MREILSWDRVSFAYDGRFEIKDASFQIGYGDFVLFFGPNGAGKTTLFKLAAGLLKPFSGQLRLDELPLSEWNSLDMAKRVAFLEQDTQYIFPFTVEEIVLMGRFPHTASQYWDRKEDFEIAAWAMEITGTLKFAKRSIFQLSGGERRKVEIARALCQKPKLFLLDEPTSFLDVRQQIELFDTLSQLNADEKISIALISHQLDLAKQFVKSAVFIDRGGVIESGAPNEMLSAERINSYFGIQKRKKAVSD